MLRSRKKRAMLFIAALVLCLGAGGVLRARADGFATYGTAQNDTSFYVSATGPASVTLRQSGPGLAERQYIYNTANTATEYVYAQYTVLYKGAQETYWRQGPNWTGVSCTLRPQKALSRAARAASILACLSPRLVPRSRYNSLIAPDPCPGLCVPRRRACSGPTQARM